MCFFCFAIKFMSFSLFGGTMYMMYLCVVRVFFCGVRERVYVLNVRVRGVFFILPHWFVY